MLYCQPATVLTKALSKHPDNSAEFRAKALIWFNEIVRDILNQPREWAYLSEPHTITIINNTVTLPNGAGTIISVKVEGSYLPLIEDIETLDIDDTTVIYGYTLSNVNILTLYGTTAATTAEVQYNADITTDYTDAAVDTVFPLVFENLLITGVRLHIYDYDKDGRYGKEEAKYAIAMSQLKSLDNKRKADDRTDSHGYTKVKWDGQTS